jgi:hypothetical protein
MVLSAGCTDNNDDRHPFAKDNHKLSKDSFPRMEPESSGDSTVEDFYTFLDDFSNDSDFQVSRIVFPFVDCDVNNDSSCTKILKSKWSFLKLIDNHEVRVVRESNCNDSRSEFKIYAIISPEGPGSLYYFKNVSGKWYLHHRVSYED